MNAEKNKETKVQFKGNLDIKLPEIHRRWDIEPTDHPITILVICIINTLSLITLLLK